MATLSPGDIARRHGQLVIEDDSYAYLAEDSPPPLATLAPDITIHLSSLSKSIATQLHVGSLTAPAPLVPALERAIRATAWNAPALTVAIACRWLDDGTADRIAATLARHHISVPTAEPFATTSHTPQAIRLALGSANLDGLPIALRAVAHVIRLDAAQ